jgi:hypothetical protein
MGVVEITDFFPEIASDLTNVTWAHAVNSQAKLDAALTGMYKV